MSNTKKAAAVKVIMRGALLKVDFLVWVSGDPMSHGVKECEPLSPELGLPVTLREKARALQ